MYKYTVGKVFVDYEFSSLFLDTVQNFRIIS